MVWWIILQNIVLILFSTLPIWSFKVASCCSLFFVLCLCFVVIIFLLLYFFVCIMCIANLYVYMLLLVVLFYVCDVHRAPLKISLCWADSLFKYYNYNYNSITIFNRKIVSIGVVFFSSNSYSSNLFSSHTLAWACVL